MQLPTPRSIAPPRGVAMLLVLVCLATATVLATSYLAARDNSAAIGGNVAAAAEARWAALSGVDLAVGVLETETDWRTNHVGGVLLDDHPVGGATVDLVVEDRRTSAPPTEETRDVVIRSTATADGVEQTATAYATVMPDAVTQAVNVDLREFAVFVDEELVLRDDAAIGRWKTSSSTTLGTPLNVGVLNTAASSVRATDDAVATDLLVWTKSTASGFLVSDGSGTGIATTRMHDDRIPFPASPAPSRPPNGFPEAIDAPWGMSRILNGLELWEDAQTSAPVTVATLYPTTLVVDDQLGLNASRMRIQHPTEIIVYGDLKMLDSQIVIEPGGSLDLFVAGEIVLRDSAIGPGTAAEGVRTADAGAAPYVEPGLVRVWSNDSGTPGHWVLENASTLIGVVHAPTKSVIVRGTSEIYGRVTSRTLELRETGALWYDPSLDSGYGFTNKKSMLYEESGELKAAVRTVNDLSDAELQLLADATGVSVEKVTDELIERALAGGLLGGGKDEEEPAKEDPAPPPAPGSATPRPIPVVHTLVENGGDVQLWESRR